MVNRQKKSSYQAFVCDECALIFSVYIARSVNLNRKFYCPNCGDDADVRRYNAEELRKPRKEQRGKTGVKTDWSMSELNLLELVIKGKYQPYQVAILTGRTLTSVNKRLQRLKEFKRELESHEKS